MSPKKAISYLTEQSNYLKEQSRYVDKLSSSKNGYGFVSLGELVQSLRSMGYNDTFKSLAELIDNAIEAFANHIIIVIKKTGKNMYYKSTHVGGIAVVDDGYGMEPDMIRAALRYGGTHRYNSRNGIGRFGMGLPGSCGSLTENYSLYAKLDDNEFHCVHVSLKNIVQNSYEGEDLMVPKSIKTKLPNWIGNVLTKDRNEKEVKVHDYLHGTVVDIKSPDRLTPGYVQPASFISKITLELGLTYRNYLENNRISIIEYDEKANRYSKPQEIQAIDPLFLREDARFYEVEENEYIANAYKPTEFKMEGKDGKMYPVKIRYSLLHPGFRLVKNTRKRVTSRSEIMTRNHGKLTLTRAGRQMSVVKTTYFPTKKHNSGLENNDVFWNVEVDFHPGLDEKFNVPANKQSASPGYEAWTQFENHKMPAVIAQMKGDWDDYNAPFRVALDTYIKSEGSKHQHELVSDIIIETRKKDTVNARSEEVADAIANKRNTVKTELKGSNTPQVKIDKFLEDVDLDYSFQEEDRPESPFYRVKLDGETGKVIIYLNTSHLFFQHLYANASVAQRDALKLLIYSLADTELNSSARGRMWYKAHRPKWSSVLTQTLQEHKNRYSDGGTMRMLDMTGSEAKKAAKAEA